MIRWPKKRSPIIAAGGGATDPYWANVVLLAGNDSQPDGSTTIADQSSAAHGNATVAGNTQYDTAEAPTGLTSSIRVDGAGDDFRWADHADWTLGTTASVEFAIKWAVVPASSLAIMTHGYSSGGQFSWQLYHDGTNQHTNQSTTGSDNFDDARAWTPTTTPWYWVQMIRDGSVQKLAIDGAQIGTDITLRTLFNSNRQLIIGGQELGFFVNCWLAAIRITAGVARDIGAMPTLPLPTS